MITGPITDAERVQVRDLWRYGLGPTAIARAMSRNEKTVRGWITALREGRTIAGRADRRPIPPEVFSQIRTLDARGMRAEAIARELRISVDVARRGRKRIRSEERRSMGRTRRVVSIRAGALSATESERESVRLAAWFAQLTRHWAQGREPGRWWA
jgi:transposase-like protein